MGSLNLVNPRACKYAARFTRITICATNNIDLETACI